MLAGHRFGSDAAEPWNGALNEKMPPSPPSNQYPLGGGIADAGAGTNANALRSATTALAMPIRVRNDFDRMTCPPTRDGGTATSRPYERKRSQGASFGPTA